MTPFGHAFALRLLKLSDHVDESSIFTPGIDRVRVTLDGIWESLEPDVTIGTVRRFRYESGHRDGFDGWGVAIKRHRVVGQDGPRDMLRWLGALVVHAPTRTETFDGEEYIVEQHNFGIDEQLIESAVRSVDYESMFRGRR